MKVIYEHDEQEDFIEIHLSDLEIRKLLLDKGITKDIPAMLHSRRSTNVFIRKAKMEE